MCDYSLHSVASRPAKVGDKLVSTQFNNSFTRGFAAVGEPHVVVCLLPAPKWRLRKRPSTRAVLASFRIGCVGRSGTRWLGSGRSIWTIRIHITTRLSFPMEHLCWSMHSVKVSTRRCCNCLLLCTRQRSKGAKAQRRKGAFLWSASRIACDRSPRHGRAWPGGCPGHPSLRRRSEERRGWPPAIRSIRCT